MEKFSNWVKGREEINLREGLAYELVRLDIDPNLFYEWALGLARKGQLNEAGNFWGGVQGLLSGAKEAWKKGVETSNKIAAQKALTARINNMQAILDKVYKALVELGVSGPGIEKGFNTLKNQLQSKLTPEASPAKPAARAASPVEDTLRRPVSRVKALPFTKNDSPITRARAARYGVTLPENPNAPKKPAKPIIPDDIGLAP
jgi:hypothetical protein